ncbi:CaiB/BaiF CoA transferase family protein [Methyloversatilis thermotolerans]|uniref:CaiB/BaiF CoA transferase family protein n=1 Tax=Methyloversatilis thermotolerans TaxID=1346290 RepID=UPI000382566F|nr:CaiB/BaiF CoA-transferase family protein [Methyloversatilis thermotolerans]
MKASHATADAPRPLDGLKVIELGTLIAGPFASRILADFGAEVIKIESPDGGDPLRKWRLMYEGTSLWWFVQSRNKKSVALNLKHPEALDALRALLHDADVLVENFRPGVLDKLGLTEAVLRELNPALVVVRLSGFGQTGPLAQQPGFGAIGESMGGLRFITGFPDRPPVKVGISIGDSIASLWGVIGALMALRHRDATGGRRAGQGQTVDVALYEAVFAMMESMLPEFDVFGFVRGRTGNIMPGITPSNTHTARDGRHILIGGNGDAIFRRLMHAIGRPDLADDRTLADNAGRDARRDELYAVIDAWVARHDGADVIKCLEEAEVPVSQVYSIEDIARDPHYLARAVFEQAHLPDGRAFRMPAPMPRLSATPGRTEWTGPALGQHTDEVLVSLGYDRDRIVALRQAGAIG